MIRTLESPSPSHKSYRVAPKFVWDHWARDCGENDVLRTEGKYVLTVWLDQEGWDDMLSDADYYWDCRDEIIAGVPYSYMRTLCDSAKRVADALRKQGRPDGGAQGFDAEIRRSGLLASKYSEIRPEPLPTGFITIPKARCTSCDWIVDVDDEGIAEPHGWRGFGQCPGSGTPSEDPNCKTF